MASYANFFSVFNTSLDTKRLLRSGDVHLNPGPSSNQLPKASQLIANSYKDPWQTHNSGRIHIVYTSGYLKLLQKCTIRKLNQHVEHSLLSLGIYYQRRARGTRAGQKVQRRAPTRRAFVAYRPQDGHFACQFNLASQQDAGNASCAGQLLASGVHSYNQLIGATGQPVAGGSNKQYQSGRTVAAMNFLAYSESRAQNRAYSYDCWRW